MKFSHNNKAIYSEESYTVVKKDSNKITEIQRLKMENEFLRNKVESYELIMESKGISCEPQDPKPNT